MRLKEVAPEYEGHRIVGLIPEPEESAIRFIFKHTPGFPLFSL